MKTPVDINSALTWLLAPVGGSSRTLGWRFHGDSNTLTIKGYENATMSFEFEVEHLRRIRKLLGQLMESEPVGPSN